MIDARGRGLRDLGLGVVGDAEARRLDHRDVVGAVAGHQGALRRQRKLPGELDQGRELGFASEDRLRHVAGQAAVAIDYERVGAVLVEPDERRDAPRE